MKLRIKSDGTPAGTRLLDEDGRPIEGVASIGWSLEPKDRATAVVVFRQMEIDAEGESEIEPYHGHRHGPGLAGFDHATEAPTREDRVVGSPPEQGGITFPAVPVSPEEDAALRERSGRAWGGR